MSAHRYAAIVAARNKGVVKGAALKAIKGAKQNTLNNRADRAVIAADTNGK